MSKQVFISYSSVNSDFVHRLAADLLKRQTPVWLDAYELAIGDNLGTRLINSIEESSYVLIIWSAQYNQTKWTTKEFQAVLEKERRNNKKYLIPLVIDETPLAVELSERINLDFRTGYFSALNRLTLFLNDQGITLAAVSLSERQVVLRFTNHVEIDGLLLKNILFDLHKHADVKFSASQLYNGSFSQVNSLLDKADKIMTAWTGDDALRRQYERDVIELNKCLKFITQGMLLLLNNYYDHNHIELLSISISIFLKALLTRIYSIITCYLDEDTLVLIGLSRNSFLRSPFADSESFQQFYRVAEWENLVVFSPKQHFAFLADRNELTVRELRNWRLPQPLSAMMTSDLLYRYFIPQNVFSHLFNDRVPLLTKFESYQIGLN